MTRAGPMASTALGQPLDDPPTDGITALRFSATSDLLMATSWDGVRALRSSNLQPLSRAPGPVLDACRACLPRKRYARPAHRQPAGCAPAAGGGRARAPRPARRRTVASPLAGRAQTARLYDAGRRTLRGSYALVAPALDGAFQDDSVVYVGGLDGLVRRCARPPPPPPGARAASFLGVMLSGDCSG